MLSGFNVSSEDLKKISSFLKPLKLNKGSVFINEGVKNEKTGVMLSELMNSNYISEKGNRVSGILSLIALITLYQNGK